MLSSVDNALSIIDICVCLVDFALIAYLVRQGRRGGVPRATHSRIRRVKHVWPRAKVLARRARSTTKAS